MTTAPDTPNATATPINRLVPPTPMDDAKTAETVERIFFELRKVIVGQSRLLERMLVGLLARGHCLLESVPGLAKTLAAETLADVVGGSFARIQFTPDLLPSDIVGTRIYRGSSETFDVELGPGVRQLPPDRRDQPGPGQGAVGAARGDAGAPGDDRRRHPPGARPVLRRRHPEPDRERGRVPAARRPARPVHDEDRPRPPVGPRGDGDHRPHVGEPADRRAGDRPRRSQGPAAQVGHRVRRPQRLAVRRRPRAGDPQPRPVRPRRAEAVDRPRRQPAGEPQPRQGRRAPWR